MSSKRRPYIAPVSSSWWNKRAFYRFYMLREATAIPTVWFSCVLLYGLWAVGEESVESAENFIHFLQHPVVLCLNVLALFAALLHTVTWFNLAPKASNVVIGDKKLSPAIQIGALWIAFFIVSVTLLVLALYF